MKNGGERGWLVTEDRGKPSGLQVSSPSYSNDACHLIYPRALGLLGCVLAVVRTFLFFLF